MVFEDRAAAGLLGCLRPGFRHCFCAVETNAGWIVCDALKGPIVLDAVAGVAVTELVRAYRDLRGTVLVGRCRVSMPRWALAPLTCVEVVKRVVGLDAPLILTPFQLWRRLQQADLGFLAATPVDVPSF